jgi:hypothetical protein
MSSFIPPPGYARIRQVGSFHELVSTPLAQGVNALCWSRDLPGDFAEVVGLLGRGDGIATVDEARLRSLPASAAGRAAIEVLIADLQLLQAQGLAPVLDCIHGYPRDEEPDVIATDVYSFHADSAPVEADTYLCTYHGPTSEGLRNEDAIRRVDLPATRAELLRRFGGEDNAAFREHLRECCYDLHYAPADGAQPFSFGQGNLWRIAIDYPGCPVPPCVHRAPLTLPGQPPRLLLIA